MRESRSKYEPHQGKNEKWRRQAQIARVYLELPGTKLKLVNRGIVLTAEERANE